MAKPSHLINKFLSKEISSLERQELKKWVSQSDANSMLFKQAIKTHYANQFNDFDSEMAYEQFMNTITAKNHTKVRNLYQYTRYAAVVVFLLSLGFLVQYQWNNQELETGIPVAQKKQEVPVGNEIVIKMADGSVQTLSATGDEDVLDENGNLIANKHSSTLSFKGDSSVADATEERYNEVYIPFGQKFELQLSDGTKVWLNAGSKLRFPQKFVSSKSQRMVYLEGEAFFDVATNKEKPFVVNAQEVDIKVLGTQFNVSSYASDTNIATTLVEGSVSVYETRTPENTMVLTPSYQATYDKFGNSLSKKIVNTDDYTAWITNRLVINNLSFSEIIAKLERRHQVKIINNNTNLNKVVFKGEFQDESIESILETIALSTPFNFKIDQNIITITN